MKRKRTNEIAPPDWVSVYVRPGTRKTGRVLSIEDGIAMITWQYGFRISHRRVSGLRWEPGPARVAGTGWQGDEELED